MLDAEQQTPTLQWMEAELRGYRTSGWKAEGGTVLLQKVFPGRGRWWIGMEKLAWKVQRKRREW
jgi:hypothetical protein